MSISNARIINGSAFLISVFSMAFALYLEHYQNLAPCPLCIFQRVFVILAGLAFLIAFIHNSKTIYSYIYASLALSASVGGITVAGRHVWLQNLPPSEVPSCGPGLDYLLNAFPLNEVLQTVFTGSGECANISWSLLYLTLPEWVLILFTGLCAMSILQLVFNDTVQISTQSPGHF